MRSKCFNASLCLPVLVTSVALLLGSAVASGQQQQINLSAGPTSTTLPDGQTVPMWGYACGAPVSGSLAACSALNHAATGWSPVLITVPTGQSLQINLSNNLIFGPNGVPTSIVIVGQLGGGLGTTATKVASPAHSTQNTTWQIAASGPQFTPPNQPKRVQSFTTEVAPAAVGSGTPVSLVWNGLKPGTYLIESGTHPSIQGPMGLYGVLVVRPRPPPLAPRVPLTPALPMTPMFRCF